MAYRIDFTERNYAIRLKRKIILRVLLVLGLAAAVWQSYVIYDVYNNEPTLNRKLLDYAVVARDVEKANEDWDQAAKEYNSMLHYYRFIWATSPTNFVEAVLQTEAWNNASLCISRVDEAVEKLCELSSESAVYARQVRDAVASLKDAMANQSLPGRGEYYELAARMSVLKAAFADFLRDVDQKTLDKWSSQSTDTNLFANSASSFGCNYHPRSWVLNTGGECRLEYDYVFDSEDKASEALAIENNVANVVTSLVETATGKIDINGVKYENLLAEKKLGITVQFKLADVKPFPTKEKALAECANEIAAMRKRIQETKLPGVKDARDNTSTAKDIMIAYLPKQSKPGYPEITDVLNVSGWFNLADKFIKDNRVPIDEAARRKLKARWNKIGEAKFPWHRFRILDNQSLVSWTRVLLNVAQAAQKYKDFFAKRKADYRRKLKPLVESYNRNDVFNKPIIEPDLKDKAAAFAGISRVRVEFSDEPKAEPVLLCETDENFTFTWIRWTMYLGSGVGREAERLEGSAAASSQDQLTLANVADCTRRILELGPGYVLRSMTLRFHDNGNISGAVLEGLLPVKKVEKKDVQSKEGAGNGH